MRARFGTLLKGIRESFRRIFGGAVWIRTKSLFLVLSKAQDAPGEDRRQLVTALVGGHIRRVERGVDTAV
jgi:hypothetical protein